MKNAFDDLQKACELLKESARKLKLVAEQTKKINEITKANTEKIKLINANLIALCEKMNGHKVVTKQPHDTELTLH